MYVGTATPWAYLLSGTNGIPAVTELTPRATEDTLQDQITAKPIVGLSGITIPAGSSSPTEIWNFLRL